MTESDIIFYTMPNGQISVLVQYEDGSFWLTQKRMAELFGVESHTITYHLKEIYQSGELQILNQFLELSQYPILQDKGKISAVEAKIKAEQEYDVFRTIQDENYLSDFDREIKRIQGI